MRRVLKWALASGLSAGLAACSSSSDYGNGYGGNGGGGGGGGGACNPSDSGTVAKVLDCAGQTIAKTITLQNFAFSPASETIKAGEVVKFDNQDTATHTVTSGKPSCPDGKWNTGDIPAGSSKCVEIDVAGTYPYFCSIHPSMTGNITVD